MEKVTIKAERCKSCGLCIAHCPKKCISFGQTMNKLGYHPVEINHGACVACGSCYATCPDGVYAINA